MQELSELHPPKIIKDFESSLGVKISVDDPIQ